LVADADGVLTASAAAADGLSRTHDHDQLIDQHRYLDREDADDLDRSVECLNRFLDGDLVGLGDVPQTELDEVRHDASYHPSWIIAQLRTRLHAVTASQYAQCITA